jgi:hypothetical protein
MAQCYRATIAAMPAFHPLADTVASALRTLVLLGVLSALAGLPAAAIARLRGGGSPGWLAVLAGPAITIHGLNLAFFVVLALRVVVDAGRGNAALPSAWQVVLFAASFLVPNLTGGLAWRYVRRRQPEDGPPRVTPSSERI